jgi:zinc transport system permease protein
MDFLLTEILRFDFMQNALAAGFLVAVVCGVLGSFVVVNRMVSLAGGIAHCTYGGLGVAVFFGFPYWLGVLGFTSLASLLMAGATYKNKAGADSIIGVLWAAGMALGVLLVDLTPGYAGDFMAYLFGSILTVPGSVLWGMLALTVLILLVVAVFYKPFVAISYDPEFAKVRGLKVFPLHLLLVLLLSWAIVMAVQAVGLILVIALLTLPAQIARAHTRSLAGMMLLASAVSLVLTVGGTLLAVALNLTVGPVIILLGILAFLFDYGALRLRK